MPATNGRNHIKVFSEGIPVSFDPSNYIVKEGNIGSITLNNQWQQEQVMMS